MMQIIQKWLTNRLGIIPDMIPEHFLELAQDGKLIAKIFYNYKIINEEQLNLVEETSNSVTAYNYLNIWLQKIGIHFTDDELFIISQGESEQLSYDLFYQLYVVLQDKNSLHFISEQQTNLELPNDNEKFQVTPVKRSLIDNFFIENNPLGAPIAQNWDIINWHKDHLTVLKSKLEENRKGYQQYLDEKAAQEQKDTQEYLSFFPPEYTDDYKGLLEQEEEASKLSPCQPNLREAKKLLRKIQNKHQKDRLRKAIIGLLQKEVFDKLLKSLEDEKDKFYDKTISEKLLKQSNYEKEMILKMFEVKMQKDIFMENRKLLNEALNKEKEEEFIRNLFLESKSNLDYYLDMERNLELHKRLYEEKQRLKAEKRRNFCEKVVYDLIDLSLKHAEHKEIYDMEPSRSLQADWGTHFVKGIPILESLQNIEKPIDGFPLEANSAEDIKPEDIVSDDVLDQNEFEVYLNIMKTVEIYYGMNVLGFIVHRVLHNKYLPPPPPPKPQLPQVEYAISLNGLGEELELGFLQKLLTELNFKLIQIEDAVNFCLEAYQKETADEPQETSELPPDNKKAKQAVQDKQVQATFEEIVLTRKAELGSIAYEEMNLGQPLGNQMLVEMFLEYLRGMPKVNGWVLLNYPRRVEEVAVLEEELTAIRIPKRYYNQNTEKDDEEERKKLSQLVPNPSPLPDPSYEPYLNGYLRIEEYDETLAVEDNKCDEMMEKVENSKGKSEGSSGEKGSGDNAGKILNGGNGQGPNTEKTETGGGDHIEKLQDEILNPEDAENVVKIIDENEEKDKAAEEEDLLKKSVENLEKFYTDLGCYFPFRYTKIETEAIKEVVKFITTLPKKPIEEIVVEEKVEEKGKKGKKGKGKKEKGGKKGKGGKKDKSSKKSKDKKSGKKDKKGGKKGKKGKAEVIVPTFEEKGTQIPEVPDQPIEIKIYEPGEFGYVYLNLPIRLELEIPLATFWENIEKTFIDNIKNLFYTKRTLVNTITPYLSDIKKQMAQYIIRPDDSEERIKQFHEIFSEFDQESLDDKAVKDELRCRLDEFREKMMEVCDNRIKENEAKRDAFMQEKWITEQKKELSTIYVGGYQIEIDRFVETVQLLNDYYTLVLMKKKNPSIFFEKIKLDAKIENKIESNYQKSLKFVETIEASSTGVLDELNQGLTQAQGKTKKKKLKSDHDEETILKIFKEWTFALNGELARCRLHLDLLRNEANSLNNETDQRLEAHYDEMYDTICNRYETEVNKVEQTCDVLEILMELVDKAMETPPPTREGSVWDDEGTLSSSSS